MIENKSIINEACEKVCIKTNVNQFGNFKIMNEICNNDGKMGKKANQEREFDYGK